MSSKCFKTIDQILPYYVAGLPFYQRIYASALACSLRDSMAKCGLNKLNYLQAQELLID